MNVNVKIACVACGWSGGGTWLPAYPRIGSKRPCPGCGSPDARVLAPGARVTAQASVKLEGRTLEAELDRRAADHNIKVALPAHFEAKGQRVPRRLIAHAERRIARAKATT